MRAEELDSVQLLKATINQVVQELPEKSRRNPQTADVVHALAYASLTNQVQTSWQAAISHLDDIASDRSSKVVLFRSLENLPPKDYIGFLNQALVLWNQGKLSHGEFEDALFPQDRMKFFISYNYSDPEVANFLKLASQVALRKDDPIYFNLQEMMSGKAMLLNERLRKSNPTLYAAPVPMVVRSVDNKAASRPATSQLPEPEQTRAVQSSGGPTAFRHPVVASASEQSSSSRKTTSLWCLAVSASAMLVILALRWRRYR